MRSPMMRLLLPALLLLFPVSVRGADRPNVLFITVDDMNWDSVGAFGCRVSGITPNIDRLASEGMRFSRGHVTIAICQPTRAVWMTGRYPHRSGALGFDPINPGVPTLLEALKKGGYFTGIMAKVPHVVPTRGKAWDVVVKGSELRTGRDPALYYARAKAFFQEARASDRPFFLMANAQDPHRPFAGSAQEAARIERIERNQRRRNTDRGRRPAGNARAPAPFPEVSRTYQPREITVPDFLPSIPEVRLELAEYFTSVHRADEVVGSVLRALKETGLAGDTLVMFLSDHGMALPFAKTNCYYNSTRTPWIVRWPGIVRPGTIDEAHFISGIDFAPTILEAVSLPPLEGIDGRSFLPLLKGRPQSGRDQVFTHINTIASKRSYPMRSVQNARFGYIYNAWSDGKTVFRNESQSGRTMKAMIEAARSDAAIARRVHHFLYRTPEELYDYEKDPAALHNLVDDPKYAEQLEALRRQLEAHLRETKDPELAGFLAAIRGSSRSDAAPAPAPRAKAPR